MINTKINKTQLALYNSKILYLVFSKEGIHYDKISSIHLKINIFKKKF